MKTCKWLILVLLVFVAHAYGDLITGDVKSDRYWWTYAYDITLKNDAINVGLDLNLVGDSVSDAVTSAWEYGIESRWSTNRFDVPILFDVQWVDVGQHKQINVIDGYGSSTVYRWYTTPHYWSSGYVAAHEFGHLLGLYDEYNGGAVDPETGLINTGGIMHTDGATLDYYYDDILDWYGQEMSAALVDESSVAHTPEPATMVLLGSGLIALAAVGRRKK